MNTLQSYNFRPQVGHKQATLNSTYFRIGILPSGEMYAIPVAPLVTLPPPASGDVWFNKAVA